MIRYKELEIESTNNTKKKVKITQYADDASLMLKNGEQILNALDEGIEFGKVSGPKLNVNKTEGLLYFYTMPIYEAWAVYLISHFHVV